MTETLRPPPDLCEPTKWHSKQKHAFLEAYLRVWTERVGGKDAAPSLDIVDLNAGYGWCHDAELGETWEGTAMLAARALAQYQTKFGKRLVLNSYDPEREGLAAKQSSALRKAVDQLDLEQHGVQLHLLSRPSVEATLTAAALVRKEFPNLWILDPYHPDALPWSVVAQISNLTHRYRGRGDREVTRRPELFINLVTSTLQRNITKTPELFSRAIGLPVGEWQPEFDALRSEGLNALDAIVQLYAGRLDEIYKRQTLALRVPSTTGNIVYTLLFCSAHDAGFYMMRQEGLPRYELWREKKWTKPAKDEVRIKRAKRGLAAAGHRIPRVDEEF